MAGAEQRDRRPATAAELKALAHPLRLRIVRLCRQVPRTNRELAELLDRDPATTLHHVRLLVDQGFLAADAPRTGRRGAREKPYVATGLQFSLDLTDEADLDGRQAVNMTIIDAARAEVADAGPGAVLELSGIGVRLTADRAEALRARLDDLVEELRAHPGAEAGARSHGVLVGLYRLRDDA